MGGAWSIRYMAGMFLIYRTIHLQLSTYGVCPAYGRCPFMGETWPPYIYIRAQTVLACLFYLVSLSVMTCLCLFCSWLQHMKELNLALEKTFWWKRSQSPQVLLYFPRETRSLGVANGKCNTLQDCETSFLSIFLCEPETFCLSKL